MTLLLLLACVGGDKPETGAPDTDTGECPPDIRVLPDAIDFGAVAVGASAGGAVAIENQGCAALELHDIFLDPLSRTPWDLSAVGSVLLPPGGQTTFSVGFTPDEAVVFEATILIGSNDPDTPTTEVPLTGTGLAPRVSIDASACTFTDVTLGCTASCDVGITNVGTDDLVVSDFDFVTASEDLTFDEAGLVLPVTLAPAQSATATITYAPVDLYADEAFLAVVTNDPFEPEAQVHVAGSAVAGGWQTDSFVAEGRPVDIVFTLDTSASMTASNAALDAAWPAFLDALAGVDYRLAVVVTDDACVLGDATWVDPTMAREDQLAALSTMALTGWADVYDGMGFTLLELALTGSNAAAGGCNEGLVRGGPLALVGVANGVETSASAWSHYLAIYQSLVAEPDDVVIHAIAPDMPDGCDTRSGGQGWYEATVATGGTFTSWCTTDWDATMAVMAAGVTPAPTDTYALSGAPVPETIAVTVNGAVVNDWAYDAAARAVVLGAGTLAAGDALAITYAADGCD